MEYLYIIIAILTLFLGHYAKVYRWGQFIQIYEKPQEKTLLSSLSIGYLINFFIPFRIGDLFRAFFSGRKMKNGLSFSLATIIVDRYLDIVAVGLIYLIFYFLGFNTAVVLTAMKFYIIAALVLLIIAAACMILQKYIKLIIKNFFSIFNTSIKLRGLKFAWFGITSFKDIIEKLNRKKLFLSTLIMWGLYLFSYYSFSLFLNETGLNINVMDVFMMLFSQSNLDVSTISSNQLLVSEVATAIYILCPLALLIISSYIPNKLFKNESVFKFENKNFLELLPQINNKDRLSFLEGYFSGTSREYFKNYLKINGDISIFEDFSAGSNATTILCISNNKTVFRKYAFEEESKKLYAQVEWLKKHNKKLKLTSISSENHGSDFCYYDMPFINDAVSCFKFVHSSPTKEGWKTIETVLEDINKKLHKPTKRKMDNRTLNKYIETKILGNIKKIEVGREIKKILKYDTLIINGKEFKNLNQFKKYFEVDYLQKVFKNDNYSDIHGDLTIENIICLNNKQRYYLIDPNTGNLHESPYLDYAKLLQSLHGGYEFLMATKNVEIKDNNINFLNAKSFVYDELYSEFKKYLDNNFNKEQVKSIFFHEIVHWLRLMPYKIEKDEQKSVLFYAGMIKVINDVIEEYGD